MLWIVAERLSARQPIVQCGLKSQLACIYVCAQLLSLFSSNCVGDTAPKHSSGVVLC